MRVLVVGAGAVGQCYAAFLARGGAEVSFRVRRDPGTRRFVTYELSRKAFTTFAYDAAVVTTDAEVAASRPDVVLLTVPTDALREGDWLPGLLAAAGDALVVALEPGVEDAAVIRRAKPDVRLAQGIIALIAYQAPLPGETRFPEPGIAIYAPMTCPFSGPPEVRPAVDPLIAVLSKGGMKAAWRDDIAGDAAFGTLVMASWVTGLRAAKWRFDGLAETGPLAFRAVGQAMVVIARDTGRQAPFWPALLRPFVLRAGIRAAAWLIPLPLETYLGVHFTKVGAQTRLHLREVIAHGGAAGLPVDAVQALLDAADAAQPVGTK